MAAANISESAAWLSNDLRLKTLPVAVKFLKQTQELPPKTRRPSEFFKKRITICQGVTLARLYGWTVGLTQADQICVPAMLMFGFTPATAPVETLTKLFCEVQFAENLEKATAEAAAIPRLEKGEYEALALAPLAKAAFEPDTVLVYGNPAQVMRLIQAWTYASGGRLTSEFGGKVECAAYLIAPFRKNAPQVAIPGMGDRIFSMTQDDEMVFALPGKALPELVRGLKEAGGKIGARYPVTFYQNFQPEFPRPYQEVAKELGLF